jgi:flap endonuclease-1
MGIKSLTYLIKEKSPDSIQSVNLHTLKNKRVAIDTSIFLYKSLINCRYNGDYIRNNEGKIMSHIHGLYYKTIQYLSLGITPIYIFDGKPPREKNECISERNKKAQEYKEKMNQSNDKQEKLKLEKSTIRIKKEYIDDLKQLFTLMGVSYLHPDGEAEAYAGELCRLGYVDAVVTEDMDTFVYGCPIVIRNCIDKSIKRKDIISSFDLSKILIDFQMNLDEFTDMCILCGCDYCPTIPRVGQARAFQYIQKYKSIEALIASEKCQVPQDFLDKYENARKLFHIYRDKINLDSLPIHTSELNKNELQKHLTDYCNMSSKRVQTSLNKIN